jgi:uncharacterized membrane protein
MIHQRLLGAAIGAVVLLGTAVAFADKPGMEQCAGIVKGGKNDCATSKNACHGHVAEDGNPEAWIYVPTGTCSKLAGASVVSVVDPTPQN